MDKVHFLARHLVERQEDTNQMMMTLCGGDVVQYAAMQKMSAESFLIKFNEHISQAELVRKQAEAQKGIHSTPGKRKK